MYVQERDLRLNERYRRRVCVTSTIKHQHRAHDSRALRYQNRTAQGRRQATKPRRQFNQTTTHQFRYISGVSVKNRLWGVPRRPNLSKFMPARHKEQQGGTDAFITLRRDISRGCYTLTCTKEAVESVTMRLNIIRLLRACPLALLRPVTA